jgi:hypothetical protein
MQGSGPDFFRTFWRHHESFFANTYKTFISAEVIDGRDKVLVKTRGRHRILHGFIDVRDVLGAV